MDTQNNPVTPRITHARKAPGSTNILKNLKERLRGDRAKSRGSLSSSAAPSPVSTKDRRTPDRSFAPSPIESPIKSPLEHSRVSLPMSPPPRPASAGLAPHTGDTQVSASQSLDGLLSIREIPLTFAVDVSGSTTGRILRQEQDAILAVSANSQSHDLVSRSTILPWSHKSHPPRNLATVESLTSGGGTDPGALLENAACKARLRNSGLWFLLTDGQIDEPLVHRFANAIPEAGIHGTACVIVLFGYTAASPFDCNVSVGMSVFAVAPHCIFLFHDVRTGLVYVFQAKGCFANMLSEDRQFSVFGKRTAWEDLATITYESLSSVRVPAPTELPRDTVLLPDGRHFDLRDIYNDTVSEADKLDLLSDYSALDVIILAAKTRGQDELVKDWIAKSRSVTVSKDSRFLQRDDIGGAAKSTLLSLVNVVIKPEILGTQPDQFWQALYASDTSPAAHAIKSRLRHLHSANWSQFLVRVETECDLPTKMNQVFDDVLTTMNIFARHPVSPSLLTPMTSPDVDDTAFEPAEHVKRSSPLARKDHPLSDPTSPYPPPRSHPSFVGRDLLFLPGYRGNRVAPAQMNDSPSYQTCPICGQSNSIQCLLLQINREASSTPHFPQINSKARHKYPLVLGNYPETDVILPLTACDACAFVLLQVEGLPNGERVDAALPLISPRDENNRRQWLQTLNKVYQHRFHEGITLLVFLSSLCSTIEDLFESHPSAANFLECLQWCCREVSELDGIPRTAGITPVGSPMSEYVDTGVSFTDALILAFCHPNRMIYQLPFLSYPIEGFVAIVSLASQVEDIEPFQIELFAWKRLLYHLGERHLAIRQQIGPNESDAKLRGILFEPAITSPLSGTSSSASPSTRVGPSPILSISLAVLGDSYFLPESSGVAIQFQRMGDYFAPIETTADYHAALAVFLHTLLHVSSVYENGLLDAEGLFTRLRYRADKVQRAVEDSHDVFEEPKLVGSGNVTALVEEGYSLN
ncbi:uncharacterized protein DSM5745_07536 [Aspergillus mulundensis]|uniref:Uncharacterized protein n=1 Tax=Aspergillus mulundensis TaxID=1810919 RepID=A0A3D8RET4_9EURO|nr:hypothetical protein DSM5745_07536 [Aspergillus mulundensis]RDW72364.1 hypothetical protein DSM5745_07536 [Aspergillus mulundensis]